MNTQNLTSIEPVGAQNTWGSMNPSSRNKIYGSPILCARMGVGVQRGGKGNVCSQKPYSLRRIGLCANLSPPLGRKERMSLKPQAQICCGAKPGSGMACALALIQREGDEDSSTDTGRKMQSRAGERDVNREMQEGLGKRMILFPPKEGHG